MKITNDLRGDGFGAQYQSIIWTILFAEVKGDTFYYSDIESMNNGLHTNKEFIEQAVKYMNIKNNYPGVLEVCPLPNQTIFAPKWPYFYKEIERDMDRFHTSSSFEKIKNLFYKDKVSPFDKEHIHVAVHIRKLVKYDRVFEDFRDVPETYFLQTMKSIYALQDKFEKPVLFHIYSTGNREDFSLFEGLPIVFHLDDDTFQSFTGMVFADYLIITKSSMSYTAGLLSNNNVIYIPFWHPPLKHWLILSNTP